MKHSIYSKYGAAWLVICVCTFFGAGCKKLVDIEGPPNATAGDAVYSDDANAVAVMSGVYGSMSQEMLNASRSFNATVPFRTGLLSDELDLYAAVTEQDYLNSYRNTMTAADGFYSELWGNAYKYIYTANDVLQGVTTSTMLSAPVKRQLEGEARFIRAYQFFYLVNLWGAVPLTLTTDYKLNGIIPRTDADSVYDQVISDLMMAEGLLSEDYVERDMKTTTAERVRPNRYAAAALLARAYLFKGDFPKAEAAATRVIEKSALYDTVPLDKAFLMNSRETIWALQSVMLDYNTQDAKLFVLPSTGPDPGNHPVYLSPLLLDSFEVGDQRRTSWIGKWTDETVTPNKDYYYPFKYKAWTLNAALSEYQVQLRVAEQYLIRAEARARQGNTTEAAQDLDIIRRRAGLPPTTAVTRDELVAAVQHERQVELFSEGHRWLDLKRTGNIDPVMTIATPAKGGFPWKSFQQLLPMPPNDLQRNRNLTQNQGY